jgi:hypothetical protein
VRRERRTRLSAAELALITSSRPVVRRRIGPGESDRKDAQASISSRPDARKKFYPNRKHMFASSEGG